MNVFEKVTRYDIHKYKVKWAESRQHILSILKMGESELRRIGVDSYYLFWIM